MALDPLNQPGSLGFAWVPIVSNAIDTPNMILTGAVYSVTRIADGRYEINLRNPEDSSARITWPYGFSIVIVSDSPRMSSLSDGVLSSNATLWIFDKDGNPSDPSSSGDHGFIVNVLPT